MGLDPLIGNLKSKVCAQYFCCKHFLLRVAIPQVSDAHAVLCWKGTLKVGGGPSRGSCPAKELRTVIRLVIPFQVLLYLVIRYREHIGFSEGCLVFGFIQAGYRASCPP